MLTFESVITTISIEASLSRCVYVVSGELETKEDLVKSMKMYGITTIDFGELTVACKQASTKSISSETKKRKKETREKVQVEILLLS